MYGSAAAVKTMVLALYMIAGPSSWRTALRSLVDRAMMSPVRCCWEEARRLCLEVGEHVVAEVELDLPRSADDDLPRDVQECPGDEGDAQQLQAGARDDRRAEVQPQVVDRAADDHRHQRLGHVIDDERNAAPRETPPVSFQVGEQRAQAVKHMSLGCEARPQDSESRGLHSFYCLGAGVGVAGAVGCGTGVAGVAAGCAAASGLPVSLGAGWAAGLAAGAGGSGRVSLCASSSTSKISSDLAGMVGGLPFGP